MENENRSSRHWKKVLEEDNAFAGELLPDKTVAWQKMQSRLHLQKRDKKATWYWLAAASVSLLLIVPSIFLQNNQNLVIKDTINKKAEKALPEQQLPREERSNTATTYAVPLAKKESAVTFTKAKESKHTIIATNKSSAINEYPFAKNNYGDSATTSTESPLADSSLSTMVAAVLPKKALKVVHVNELGDVVQEPFVMAHTTEPHTFRLQLAKEEVFTNTDVTLNKPSLAVIKIKSSLTN